MRVDARVSRPGREARARGDGSPAASEPGRDEPGRVGGAAAGLRLDGDHARDRRRAPLGEGRSALGLAGQAAGAAARDDRARGRASDPVHERDPDRDRRDPRRAARCVALARCSPRAARSPAGGDRAELPRQAGNEDGCTPGAEPRGAPVDDRGGAPALAGRRCRAGTSQSRLRRLPAPARRGHRRLGRRQPCHDRSRQPRGSLARPGQTRSGD